MVNEVKPLGSSSEQSPTARIRVIALGLIQNADRLLVGESYDRCKQRYFYRALGGGVEFGETSEAALHREFREEIGATLSNLHYLGCIENLFVYNDRPGHELIQLYRCDFADPAFYNLDEIPGQEGQTAFTARWIAIDQFRSGDRWLVPEACLRYL